MYVTRHSSITDRALLDALWELYELSYSKIAGADPSREMLFRHEFIEVLADSTYRSTVLYTGEGQPIGMVVAATDIGSTRYLSREYFERRYPERMRAGLVHYVMWIVVHPDFQASTAVWRLAKASVAPEVEEGALVVFDVPESNQPTSDGGAAELMFRAVKGSGDVKLETLSVNRYYALDFAAPETEATDEFEFHDLESEVESSNQTT